MRIRNYIKNIKKNKANLNSLVGSICVTIAILTEQSEEAAFKELCKLKKEYHGKQFTIRKIFKSAWSDMVEDDKYKVNIPFAVLLTDNNNVFTPMVSVIMDDYILPLRKDGLETGIIASANSDKGTVNIEPLFDSLSDFEQETI